MMIRNCPDIVPALTKPGDVKNVPLRDGKKFVAAV